MTSKVQMTLRTMAVTILASCLACQAAPNDATDKPTMLRISGGGIQQPYFYYELHKDAKGFLVSDLYSLRKQKTRISSERLAIDKDLFELYRFLVAELIASPEAAKRLHGEEPPADELRAMTVEYETGGQKLSFTMQVSREAETRIVSGSQKLEAFFVKLVENSPKDYRLGVVLTGPNQDVGHEGK